MLYYIKHASADEIVQILKQLHPEISRKVVYNDIDAIKKSFENSVPLSIMRSEYNVAFEMKVRELEGKASQAQNLHDYTALQKPILENRLASLKLMGLLTDKVLHSGKIDVEKTTEINIDEKLAKEFGDWLATRKKEEN